MNWWVEYRDNGTPFMPLKPAIESKTKPSGNFWGPFHCAECATVCASFGKTERQAYDLSHGTDDEMFGVFL